METSASAVVKQKQKSYRNPPPRGNPSYPWLVICHGWEGQRQTLYDIKKDRHHIKIIPDLRNKMIHAASSREWLFVEDQDSGGRCLRNPAFLKKIELAPLEDLACSYCFLHKVEPSNGCATIFKGEICLMLNYDELAIADIENSKLRVQTSGDKDMICALSMAQIYGFTVSRMNFMEGIWEELKSIGDRTISLSVCGEISCSPKDLRVKKNAIYFV
ncbi:hypothetical protein ACJRO7_018802 [Eucalyptus globulus]|uniref:KIB1-4 beta-propeller domain-containing protein n=1 Tax=Eucalyptus globulus TaxID=34317 RepID=A0ABD3KUZ8_EUCGL